MENHSQISVRTLSSVEMLRSFFLITVCIANHKSITLSHWLSVHWLIHLFFLLPDHIKDSVHVASFFLYLFLGCSICSVFFVGLVMIKIFNSFQKLMIN